MRSPLLRWAVVVWVGIALGSVKEAQAQTARTTHNPSLIDQLDQFGRSLFGGIRPTNEKPTAQRPVANQQTTTTPGATNTVRAGTQSVNSGYTSTGTGLAIETGTSVRMHHAPTTTPPASPAMLPTASTPAPGASPTNTAALPTNPSAGSTVSPPDSQSPVPVPGSMRLHERLSAFRQSTFDTPQESGVTPPLRSDSASGAFPQPASPTTVTTSSPATSYGGSYGLRQPFTTTPPPVSQPATPQPAYSQHYSQPSVSAGVTSRLAQPTFAPRTSGTPTLAPRLASKPIPESPTLPPSDQNQSAPVPALDSLAKPSYTSSSPSIESSATSEPNLDQAATDPASTSLRDEPSTISKSAKPLKAPTSIAKGNRPPATADDTTDALFNRQGPVLNVKTIGPRRITVGKESSYELLIRNSGQVAADEVIVTVDLPEWAEVMGAEASLGVTESSADLQTSKQLAWKIAHLEAKAQEKLVLRIVPRQSRPFDLAVRWDYRPVSLEAMIEVQEPKLEMHLDGPREVLFGKREVYRLELANTGTGEAEGVEISLLPIGTGENVPATHRLGTLAAGEKKVIEVELTARQAGVLTIKVDARADGGVEASLAETIAVLRAALNVAVEAPRMQFVGNEVHYRLRVTNTGTAPATNLRVAARLPLGTKYVSSTGDAKLSAERGELTWTIDSLPAGGTKDIDLVCNLERSGINRLDVSAMADGELAASAEATMQVEAMADLRLNVVDPSGPVAVGDETTYEVIIHNRGSKGAENVEVVAYFSRGVEPTAVEGGGHKIAPGQVVFDKIPLLAAGQSVSFKIHAKADTSGNHVFRAEVYCRPLDMRLASEETTHFYGTAGGLHSQSLQASDALRTDSSNRTADRRLPGSTGSSPSGRTSPLFNRSQSATPLQ